MQLIWSYVNIYKLLYKDDEAEVQDEEVEDEDVTHGEIENEGTDIGVIAEVENETVVQLTKEKPVIQKVIHTPTLKLVAGNLQYFIFVCKHCLLANHNCNRKHFDFFFVSWRENKAGHFILIICPADNTNEMPSLIFSKKKKKEEKKS